MSLRFEARREGELGCERTRNRSRGDSGGRQGMERTSRVRNEIISPHDAVIV